MNTSINAVGFTLEQKQSDMIDSKSYPTQRKALTPNSFASLIKISKLVYFSSFKWIWVSNIILFTNTKTWKNFTNQFKTSSPNNHNHLHSYLTTHSIYFGLAAGTTSPSKFRYHQILLSNLTFLFLSISPLSYPFPLLLLHYRPVSSDCTYFWCNWGGHADQLNTPPHIVKWGGGLLFVLFFLLFSGAKPKLGYGAHWTMLIRWA